MIRSKRAQEQLPPLEPANDDSGWEGIMEALDDLDEVLKRTTKDVDDPFDAWSPNTFAQPLHLYPAGHTFWKYADVCELSTKAKLEAIGISVHEQAELEYNLIDRLEKHFEELRNDYETLYGPYDENE